MTKHLYIRDAQWAAVLRIPKKHCCDWNWSTLVFNAAVASNNTLTTTTCAFYCIRISTNVGKQQNYCVYWYSTFIFRILIKIQGYVWRKAERGALLLVFHFPVCDTLTFKIQMCYSKEWATHLKYDCTCEKGIWLSDDTPPWLPDSLSVSVTSANSLIKLCEESTTWFIYMHGTCRFIQIIHVARRVNEHWDLEWLPAGKPTLNSTVIVL